MIGIIFNLLMRKFYGEELTAEVLRLVINYNEKKSKLDETIRNTKD